MGKVDGVLGIRYSFPQQRKAVIMEKLILMLCIFALLAGCSSSSEPQPQSGKKDQGREETKKLEGASAVGYDGKAIRKSVDNTLDKSEEHNKALDKAFKSDGEK
jgi:hypothetical protein